MATFPSIDHTYGATKTSGPKIRTVVFGDGYEQRLTWGINQSPKQWSLTWQNIPESDADTIEQFLDARGGTESFTWTPPNGASAKWICAGWTKNIPYKNIATINATFRQVFEP